MILRFELAGLEVCLATTGSRPDFIGNYHDYPSSGRNAELLINVELDSNYPLEAAEPDYPAFQTISYSEHKLRLKRLDAEGEIDMSPGGPVVARFKVHAGAPSLESVIRVALSLALPQRNALILHASSVVSPDGALVFTGRSGAGKSTISNLLSEAYGLKKIADDLIVLSLVDGRWLTRVSPFAGRQDLPYAETHILGELCFLEQAEHHDKSPMPAALAMSELCRNTVNYSRSPQVSNELLQLLGQLAESQHCSRLRFAKNAGVGEVLGITCR